MSDDLYFKSYEEAEKAADMILDHCPDVTVTIREVQIGRWEVSLAS